MPASDYCFKCRNRRNHKDHYADPVDCHFYYQCFYFNQTYAVGIRRSCPAGMFWHDSILTCMPEGSVSCMDRCIDATTQSRGCYAGSGCRQFFVCANTASYGMCCPEGSQFDEATCSCELSETCLEDCRQQSPPIGTTVQPVTRLNSTTCRDPWGTNIASVETEPNAYVLIDNEGETVEKMYCPSGVTFDIDTCRCDIYNENAVSPEMVEMRRAILWLPFDDDTKDHSSSRFTTFLFDNVEWDSSSAAFGGGSLKTTRGYLSVPGLKSFDNRNAGSWCGFFKCGDQTCNVGGGIFSNNNCDDDSYTVNIETIGGGSMAAALHLAAPGGSQNVTARTIDGWNHFCLIYDGNTITLHLNGVSKISIFVSFKCPLHLKCLFFRLSLASSMCRDSSILDTALTLSVAMTGTAISKAILMKYFLLHSQ